MNFQKSMVTILAFVLLSSGCGGFGLNKKSSKKGKSSKEHAVSYLSFDDVMQKLRESDTHAANVQNTIERGWLWQNLFSHIPRLSAKQREELNDNLASLRDQTRRVQL